MLDCVALGNGRKAVSVEEKRKKLLESAWQQSAWQARLTSRRTGAKSLWAKLKEQHVAAREKLETMEDKYDLALELHAPSGSVIRIGEIWYYPDTDDALRVVGTDDNTGETCQAIVPVEGFYVIFRIRETSKPERKPVGFHAVREEGSE
jgi:hypothetical protein